MLVEHYHGQRQSTEAFHYLQEMEARRIQLHPYLDAAVIDDIYRAVGHNPNAPKRPTGSRSSPDPDDDYLGGGRGSGKETQNRWSAEEEGVDEDIDEVCMCLLPILLGILHITCRCVFFSYISMYAPHSLCVGDRGGGRGRLLQSTSTAPPRGCW